MAEQQTRERGKEILGVIRGARLSSVQFVLDYVILGFDQKGALTTLVWPDVNRKGVVVAFGMPGYRDELCAMIPEVVEDVTVSEDDTIILTFASLAEIRVPLSRYKGSGERAIFTAPKHILFTW
jgi:hypothetical protein